MCGPKRTGYPRQNGFDRDFARHGPSGSCRQTRCGDGIPIVQLSRGIEQQAIRRGARLSCFAAQSNPEPEPAQLSVDIADSLDMTRGNDQRQCGKFGPQSEKDSSQNFFFARMRAARRTETAGARSMPGLAKTCRVCLGTHLISAGSYLILPT